MDSSFTLTIDWLAFTVLASNPQETMKVLGGVWSKAKGGFRGYPLSWMRNRRPARGRQTGHQRPSSSE
jgi:phage replication initiation protein